MAKFLVIPNDGDRFDFTGFELLDDAATPSEELKEGIAACKMSGVYHASATIGTVEKPVRGVGSNGTLVYNGQDRSWKAVQEWIKQIEAEEAEVLVVSDIGCGGCLVMLVVFVLPIALMLSWLSKNGASPIIKTFFQFIWAALSNLPRAIWGSLTTGRL